MKLQPGYYYRNGHGDLCGPMRKVDDVTWLDQHGAVYDSNGKQHSHHPDSAGNIKRKDHVANNVAAVSIAARIRK